MKLLSGAMLGNPNRLSGVGAPAVLRINTVYVYALFPRTFFGL